MLAATVTTNREAGEDKLTYRHVAAVTLAVGTLLQAVPAATQTYPDRPVRLVIAFSAGGTIDTLGRILAQKLSEEWRQNVVIENRPGAGGNIGAAAAAQSAPDGYTIHFGAQSLAVNVTIAPHKGFDPVKDFEPVVLIATAQDVLMVPPDSPFRSVKDLIEHAKSKPGELNYASAGPGTSGHLATVMLNELAGIKLQHVPYASQPQAITDIMSGRISLWITTLGGQIGNLRGGKVRALAVSGSARSELFPDVPTFKEQGIGFVDETSWYGFFVPKGTPAAVVAKVNRDVNRLLDDPDMRQRTATMGFRMFGGPPDKLAGMLKSEITKWADIAKRAGMTGK
jgi:tripartite-type tricarboxylate transporter receptor subunit TctC